MVSMGRLALGLLLAILASLGGDSRADEVPALTDCRVADLDMDAAKTRFLITWQCPDALWAVTYKAVSARIVTLAKRKR